MKIESIDIAAEICERTLAMHEALSPWEIIESGRIRVPSISRATAGERIPLTPETMKPGQLRVYEAVKKAVEETAGRVMAVVLKYRQAGMSTLVRVIFSALGMSIDGYNQAMIADTGDRANLMQRIDKGIQEDMERRGVNLRKYKTSNRRELIYEDSNSITRYMSDREETVGISEARNGFHGTEIAYWRSFVRHWGDILPSLHDLPGTLIILESTANGVGGHWHKLWMDAQREDSRVIPIFLPWYEDPDLTLEAPSDWVPDEWEEALIERYKLSRDQIYWYHVTLYDPSGFAGNKALMAEKYPSTPEEAFQTSGSIVHDTIKTTLTKLMTACKPGKLYNISGADGHYQLKPHENGIIEVWHERVPGREYVMYSDVGEGLKNIEKEPQIIGGERITTTYSTCVVRDAGTWELCAILECQYPVGPFEEIARQLAHYYNNALWGIEIPGPGEAVVALAQRAEYPNLYQHEWRDADNELRRMKEYGFRNNAQSKPRMESDWEEFVRTAGPEVFGSARIATQALTYISDPRTAKHRPRSGCFSDILLADYGCIQLLQSGGAQREGIRRAIRDYVKAQEDKKRKRNRMKLAFR